jgi:UDP-3-O-[3-hydroxymyristoyl] glucosamine N-acyltransferase
VSVLGTLAALAERTGGRVVGDPSVHVERITAIDDADPTALTFAVDERYLRAALASRAGAILTDEALVAGADSYAKPLLVVASTRVALAAILAALEPQRPRGPFVHPTAVVDPSARVGSDTWIGPHVVIGAEAQVGTDALFHPRAYVADRCIVGARVVLQAGAVIGSDGFGWAFLDGRLLKIPQVGIVRLGDDVEIGANTCVDRAQTGETSVGEGTKIDNLCQIGHNCRLGKHDALAALTGLAGTTTIGDYVRVGGHVGFKGHITIGSGATIAGGAMVWGDVPDRAFVSGDPAQNHRDALRIQAYVRRLPKLFARVDALESGRDPDKET